MKILIVCVNYNSYSELEKYLGSIDMAAMMERDTMVDVVVVDNSPVKRSIETERYGNILVRVENNDNLGYLGGASSVINKIDVNKYDYVAISNVDLTLQNNFFQKLEEIKNNDNIAWIAPRIYSRTENRDRNPKVLERYSKRRLKLIYYMYKIPVLYYLYMFSAYKRKKVIVHPEERKIYAGHGSFMLLTNRFLSLVKKIEYPVFLFGEELFIAELCREYGMDVKYTPSVVVNDCEHISTSRMKKSYYFKCNQEAIRYIINKFYE